MIPERNHLLIDAFFNLGICISYYCLLQLTIELGNGVCKQFKLDGVVCLPKNAKLTFFTVVAVDNLNHNPTATTAKFISWHWNFTHAASFPHIRRP